MRQVRTLSDYAHARMLAAERYGPTNGIAWRTKPASAGDDCICHIGYRDGRGRRTVVCSFSWEGAVTLFQDLLNAR